MSFSDLHNHIQSCAYMIRLSQTDAHTSHTPHVLLSKQSKTIFLIKKTNSELSMVVYSVILLKECMQEDQEHKVIFCTIVSVVICWPGLLPEYPVPLRDKSRPLPASSSLHGPLSLCPTSPVACALAA